MATQPTLPVQTIKNLERDSDTLSQFTNGGANDTVTPRIGLPYRTLRGLVGKVTSLITEMQAAIEIAAAAGAGANGWTDLLVQTWSGRTQNAKNKDFIFIEDFNHLNSDSSNHTNAIQAAIDYMADQGGGIFFGRSTTYNFTQLVWKDNVGFKGAGRKKTILKQIVGTNSTAIIGTNVQFPLITDCTLDGNYLSGGRYALSTVAQNIGNGIVLNGVRNPHFDLAVKNIGGVGVWLTGFSGTPIGEFEQLPYLRAQITETRGEGLIIQNAAMGDGKLSNVWVGLAGLYPLIELNDVLVEKKSNVFPDRNDGRIDGIVIESTNLEYGHIHTWAHWRGCGFTTTGSCRMTGGVIISESNCKQIELDDNTYGSMTFDVRNLASFHPNDNSAIAAMHNVGSGGTIPALYQYQCDIKALGHFSAKIVVRNIHISTNHIPFTTAIINRNSAVLDTHHSSATGTESNSVYEIGSVFAGELVRVAGTGGKISVTARKFNGGVYVLGGRNQVEVNLNLGGSYAYALTRDSNSNNGSNAGNRISGAITDCTLGFNSIGAPQSEQITLQIDYNSNTSGSTPLSGTMPSFDLSKDMDWRINTFDRGGALSRKNTHKWRGSIALNASTATAQTVTVPHRFAYTPNMAQITLSVNDSATPSTAYLDYCVVNAITASDITVAYKYATADTTPAANQYVVVHIS